MDMKFPTLPKCIKKSSLDAISHVYNKSNAKILISYAS